MGYYADALAWARLILDKESPLMGTGAHSAPSLLFPMEAVFEAFVAKHLARQLAQPLILKIQVRSHHLVRHVEQNSFRLQPDLIIREDPRDSIVLDTKWKLLDGLKSNAVTSTDCRRATSINCTPTAITTSTARATSFLSTKRRTASWSRYRYSTSLKPATCDYRCFRSA